MIGIDDTTEGFIARSGPVNQFQLVMTFDSMKKGTEFVWLAGVSILHPERISLGEMAQIYRHGIRKSRRDFREHSSKIPGKRCSLVLMQ